MRILEVWEGPNSEGLKMAETDVSRTLFSEDGGNVRQFQKRLRMLYTAFKQALSGKRFFHKTGFCGHFLTDIGHGLRTFFCVFRLKTQVFCIQEDIYPDSFLG